MRAKLWLLPAVIILGCLVSLTIRNWHIVSYWLAWICITGFIFLLAAVSVAEREMYED